MNITIIPIEYVDRFWDEVRPLLEPAVMFTSGRFNIHDVYAGLQRGQYHLWVAFNEDAKNIVGSVVTEIIDYPQKRCLNMHFIGGDSLKSWIAPMNEMLGKWAKDQKCELIEGYGRSGWSRFARKYGFSLSACTFERNA